MKFPVCRRIFDIYSQELLISRILLPPSLTEHVEFACKLFVRLKKSPPALCFIVDTRREMGKMKLCTLKTHFQIKLQEKLLSFRSLMAPTQSKVLLSRHSKSSPLQMLASKIKFKNASVSSGLKIKLQFNLFKL